MIKQSKAKDNKVKVTFVIPHNEDQAQISVAGDFNDWNTEDTKLIKRNNGTRSASVTLDAGKQYAFRYYVADGQWFNDDAADAYAVGDHGAENCIIDLTK